jgi:hypothetical protein
MRSSGFLETACTIFFILKNNTYNRFAESRYRITDGVKKLNLPDINESTYTADTVNIPEIARWKLKFSNFIGQDFSVVKKISGDRLSSSNRVYTKQLFFFIFCMFI